MRVYLTFISLLASLIGCQGGGREPAQHVSVTDQPNNQPTITFLIRDLESQDANSARPESVWAQNDNMDSIAVVITGLSNMVLRQVTIDLLGVPAIEGDAGVVEKRKKVRWQSLSNVDADQLPESLGGGKQLLRIQPSVLWTAFRKLTGDGFALDSLQVSVETTDGKKVERGLAMLWD